MFPRQKFSAGRPIKYTDEELFDYSPQKTYTGEALREIAFPLGGVGTGCISLSGTGALIDWEIYNRPNKGFRPDLSFFTLYARAEDAEPTFRVMEGRVLPGYQGWAHGAQQFKGFGFGPPLAYGAGLLHFANCKFTGAFPGATIELSDLAEPGTDLAMLPSNPCPVTVSMHAWSPFIPNNSHDSSLPVAIFDITLTNPGETPVEATVALGQQNIMGWPQPGKSKNEWVESENGRGIIFNTCKHEADSARAGSLALMTFNGDDDDITYELRCGESGWFRATEILMDDFGTTGEFSGPQDSIESADNETHVAQLGLKFKLQPGESMTRTFVLAWYTPNFEKYWGANETWKVWYATKFASAQAVAEYVLQEMSRLEDATHRFSEIFYNSSLPRYVLDSISSQTSILRTPTVTRLSDGTVYGFEGCHCDSGCCEGSCTHVWAYAQTMAYLFPDLERQMRETDYHMNLRMKDGHMQFRMSLPLGAAADHSFHAAADGQMGNVLRVYREWQLYGDENWLREIWPGVKKSLEFAWEDWDADRDGLLEGIHHNTLDIEYYGPDTVCGSMYLAALRAGEEMARYLGDTDSANEYQRVFESGKKLSDERLYNGEYYFQEIPEGINAPYQYGPGCICDQVLGQWHARMIGLGDIFNPDHVRSAIASVFRYNYRDNFSDHHNPHRVYALNDDAGLLICTWPHGGRPRISVTYAFECMIGFEYQVGAHLIYEGFLREGLSVCKAVRDRHDGIKRNPWNEFECGSHYARSMANYSFLLALAGFRYSAPERTLYLAPVINQDDFKCFFSVAGAWGQIRHRKTACGVSVSIEVIEGELDIERLVINGKEISVDADTIATSGDIITVDA